MKTINVTFLHKLFSVILFVTLLPIFTLAQEIERKPSDTQFFRGRFPAASDTSKIIYAPNYILETGDILYTIQTDKENVIGVTVVNDNVIISSGGSSTEASDDNFFHVYTFDGTLVGSYVQGSTTGYGFRDLAFDGAYILGSEDNTIKKIDPNTFEIIGSITNTQNTIHRGLAYDAVDNVIWSADGSSGPVVRIDPATGATIFLLPNPVSYAKPYGLALDRFTGPQDPYLWFAEPWSYGQFRLSKVDVWDGLIYHTIDVTSALERPDSCLSGGLEIIDNHPDYPGKIIALAVEQKTNSVLFIDITGTPLPDRVLLRNRASIGGWVNRAMVENDFLYELRAHDLNIRDLADNKRKRSSTLLSAEPQGGVVLNDFLYLHYPWYDPDFKNRIEFINVSNKDRPFIAGWFTTTRIMSRGVMKLAVASVAGGSEYLLILTQESTAGGVLEKILLHELPSPASPIYKSELSADIADIAVAGKYVYALLNTPQQKLTVYEISNDTFVERGSIQISDPTKVAVSGDYAYVACTNAQGLRVIDISDPQAPFEAAAFGNGVYSFSDDILVSNDTAFLKTINLTDFEILAVDITNPLAPSEIFNYFKPPGVNSFFIFSGTYSNSLFLTSGGWVYEVDYSDPSSPFVAPGVNEPSGIQSNTAIGNKFYAVAHNKLWVYDVTEDGVPVYNTAIDIAMASKVFTDGNYLFIQDKDNLLYFYDTSLQLVGAFDAGAPVTDTAARNNILYLALYNSTDLKIVDYSNPAAPSEITTLTLPYPGTALSLSEYSAILFVASNRVFVSGNEQGYFQAVDITNPATPVIVSDRQISGGNKIHNLQAAGSLLFTGGSSDSDGLIEVFDVSDPANPARITATPYFGSPLADIAYFRGYVFAALPEARSMISYRWDASVQEFFPGPSVAMPSPVELTLFTRTPSLPDNALLRANGDAPKTYAVVNNGVKYMGVTEASKGTKVTEIVAYPPHEPQKVELTMGVAPPEAAEAGCSTIPAPGSHRYNKGAHVNLMAAPNQEKGWFFKEWTGDVSGTDLIVGVTMDRDKVATAHFEELMLTVAGTEDKRFYCASQINEQKRFVMLPVTLCASEVDDWTVSKINFKSSGTGDEEADIDEVNVFKGGVNIYKGKYAVDNGVIEASFQPPISIKAGECVTIYFNYDFSTLDVDSYASDEPKTFLVETGAVVAKPDHYESGLIAGKAQIDTLSIGRVYNSKKVVFSRIQQAINSPTTEPGDTCYVCPGEYPEQVMLNKSVNLISIDGAEKTIINGGDAWVLKAIAGGSINSFTIVGSVISADETINFKFLNNRTLVDMIDVNRSLHINFTGNTFYNLTSLFFRDSHHGKIINNQAIAGQPNVRLFQASHNEIIGNSNFKIRIGSIVESGINPPQSNFISDNVLSGIEIYYSPFNRIIANKISGSETHGIYIVGSVAIDNIIEDNEIFSCTIHGIVLSGVRSTVIKRNKIHDNGEFGLFLIDGSSGTEVYKNTVYNNKRRGIVTHEAEFSKIYNNLVSDHREDEAHGISVYNSRSTKVYSNRIWRNCTGIKVSNSPSTFIGLNNVIDAFCLFTGIHIDQSSPEIFGNNIANNTGNGVFAENGSLPVIRSNNIFGNTEFGVNNADASVSIDAQNNWWGDASGPGTSGISGSVDFSGWRTEPAALVVVAGADTALVPIGQADSVYCGVQNWENFDDHVNITVEADSAGWITGPTEFTLELRDSLGASAFIGVHVPPFTAPGASSLVRINAVSQSDPSHTDVDSFYVSVYAQVLTEMTISPDTVTVAVGDSVQFYVSGIDQYGNVYNIQASWQASIGEINETGLYKATSAGTATVTATDAASGIQATAVVKIEDIVSVEPEESIENIPTEYNLSQNYPNPFNPETTIRYDVPELSYVHIEVFNLLGQRVHTLVDEQKPAGVYTIVWDGRNQYGGIVSSGVYLVKMQARQMNGGEFVKVRKIAFVK